MAGLTRQQIVTTALGLLEEVGYEGLTTRRIAQALGVKSPALYWHFKNMRELSDALVETMLQSQDWPGPGTPGLLAPEAWLAARAHAFRRALLAHRDGAAIHAGTSPSSDALPALDLQLAALVAHGLTADDALRTVLAISRYTVGWVLEEQAQAQRDDGRRISPAPASGSTLARAQAVIDQRDRDADFAFGLHALIDGAIRNRAIPG